MSCLTTILNQSFRFVVLTKTKLNIDESHSLKHSMEVLHYAKEIYKNEKKNLPLLREQLGIIYSSAILHDMCDKKYMNETEGLTNINKYMKDYMSTRELETMSKIISTMSYSTVNKNGYPDLGEYQTAYHIVREADLLAAYDIDRCIIFGMEVEKLDYTDSLNRASDLFIHRVLKYRDDGLFVTDYSKQKSEQLHLQSVDRLKYL